MPYATEGKVSTLVADTPPMTGHGHVHENDIEVRIEGGHCVHCLGPVGGNDAEEAHLTQHLLGDRLVYQVVFRQQHTPALGTSNTVLLDSRHRCRSQRKSHIGEEV